MIFEAGAHLWLGSRTNEVGLCEHTEGSHTIWVRRAGSFKYLHGRNVLRLCGVVSVTPFLSECADALA